MHATGGTRRSLVWAMAVAVAVLIFPQAALAQNVAAAGRLVYPDGTPAAGLSVSLRSDFGSLTRVTDANGVFRFALNPRVIGTRVRVQASSGEWMFDTVVVIPRPGPSGVDLRTGTLHRMAGAAAPTATRRSREAGRRSGLSCSRRASCSAKMGASTGRPPGRIGGRGCGATGPSTVGSLTSTTP